MKYSFYARGLYCTVPGGLTWKENDLPRRMLHFRMSEEARTKGISERVFNTQMIRDCYLRMLRPVYAPPSTSFWASRPAKTLKSKAGLTSRSVWAPICSPVRIQDD